MQACCCMGGMIQLVFWNSKLLFGIGYGLSVDLHLLGLLPKLERKQNHIVRLKQGGEKGSRVISAARRWVMLWLRIRFLEGSEKGEQYKHCKHNLVVLTTEWLPWLQINRRNSGYESVTLVLKSNCIRQPKGQIPSSSYNHNTLKSLITSMIPSSGYMKVPHCNFEVHL